MGETIAKKFYWVIKDFSSLQSDKCCSDPVLIGDTKWRLGAFTNEKSSGFYPYLEVADPEALPTGWKKYVKLRFTLVNQISCGSILKEAEHYFNEKSTACGVPYRLLLSEFPTNGYLVNDEVSIFAEVNIFEVVHTLDETEKSQETSELVSKEKKNVGDESNASLKQTPQGEEINLVNSTQQVENAAKSSLKKKLVKTSLYLIKKLMKTSLYLLKKLLKIYFFMFLFGLMVVAVAVVVVEMEKAGLGVRKH